MANQDSAASSSSAPSCSASTSYPRYDVFINHRGPDVKNTFAAHLYRRLMDNGLQVFLDKSELLPGHGITPQIQAAIEIASVHVAIFSPSYAESPWCLEELELMVKSTATKRATILPVFYIVKPSDLRYNVKGAYAKALLELEQKKTKDCETGEEKPRYPSSTIQNWRSVLSQAAEISGFELEGDEEELLTKVVEGVLKNVPKTPLYVDKYPTGLEEKLQDFERTVLNEHEMRMGAKVVGILGFGGVGKTTLAREFFNRNRSHYNESSFLLDVRENSARMSLEYLQSKLIEDLKHIRNIKIESVHEGIEKLKRNLSSCHALIILDDVDDAWQLEALLPVDNLSPQSLILVTTRDRHMLEQSRVSSIYNLTGLNTPHSKELFCSHAFHQSLPPPEFKDELVDRFVTACNGLPLSLKVIGALLCGENEEYWEEQLDRLRQTLPEEIQKRLRISYDSLGKQDRPIFLDIACFFLGQYKDFARRKTPLVNKDKAIRIWGLVGIRNLENKCLLEVDSNNNTIRMHDHIRDCARSIADEESMPRRLWDQTTDRIDDLLEISSSAITEVRGISTKASVSVDRDGHMTSKSPFCAIRNLQILDSEGDYVEPILRRVQSPHLKWLRWRRCSCTCLPDWIPMKHLKVLEVMGSKLKRLWSHESKVPVELRELYINGPLSDFPNSIGQLKHLERIVIDCECHLSTLEYLPEEFCHLRSLKYLVLENFSKLVSLPDSFGKLTNLQHISLEDAYSLQRLPNSFGNLTRLKHLFLRRCSNLTISNGTLGNITTLEYLNLGRCSNVRELPPQVAHQTSLKQLHLQGTNLKELPSGIGDLCSLEFLEIGGIGNLVPETGENSMEIHLPPSLGNLKSLKHFSIYDSPKLKRLPDSFGMLTQLRELRLEKSGIEYLPQDLPKFNHLESLIVSCPLRELPFKTSEGEAEISLLKGERGWNKLDSANEKCMFGLNELRLMGTLISEVTFPEGVCPNLQHVEFYDCRELRQIEGLCGLPKCRSLSIVSCINVEELPSLETLKSLEELKVYGFRKLKNIPGLAQFTKLRRLIVSGCKEIEGLPGVEHCMSLSSLQVSECPRLKSIPGLGQLTKLEDLDVRGCQEIEGLPGVEHCMSLSSLRVSECPRLKSILGLGLLTKLEDLDVRGCQEIEGLPGVEHCMSLSSLQVSQCPRLKSIPGLGQFTKLNYLSVRGCQEIEGLPGVEHCMSLSSLCVSECPRLKSIPGSGQLTKLENLYVSGCQEIEGLPGVEHCMSLLYLVVRKCPSLKSIPGLGQFTKLIQLDVSGCQEIEGLPGVEHCMSLQLLDARDCPKLRWGEGVLQRLRLRLKRYLKNDAVQYKRRKLCA